ncbi:DUF982 domain-containing protein [Rhizobium sp. LjRoot30]|uniref:DUF982 domain-containing protein n=1 Tax=Rhizobium sp. LjRoot30 TaxID=3342320 RepID=UPI003ECD2F60
MSDIIRVNFRKKWSAPVRLRRGIWVREEVHGPADALLVLTDWPREKGTLHKAAVRVCRESLTGKVPPADARGLFVACCMDSGLLASMTEYERLGI